MVRWNSDAKPQWFIRFRGNSNREAPSVKRHKQGNLEHPPAVIRPASFSPLPRCLRARLAWGLGSPWGCLLWLTSLWSSSKMQQCHLRLFCWKNLTDGQKLEFTRRQNVIYRNFNRHINEDIGGLLGTRPRHKDKHPRASPDCIKWWLTFVDTFHWVFMPI